MSESTSQLKYVSSKDQIGSGINYHIEGVRQFGNAFLVNGWLLDPNNQCRSIIIKKPAGKVFSVAQEKWVRFYREDVVLAFPGQAKKSDLNGFAFITSDIPDPADTTKLNIIVISKNNVAFSEFVDISELTTFNEAINQSLDLVVGSPVLKEHCEKFFLPLVNSAIVLRKKPGLLAKEDFGPAVTKPDLSVIIPIYGGINLMQFQMANLAVYLKRNVELIFAIDDPTIIKAAMSLGERLSNLFNIGITVLGPDYNLGFAGINNFASNYANSRNLLFLNSDCFPVQLKWDDRVIAALDKNDYAIIGSRLLYMDDTIQHDGIAFFKKADLPGFILNDHPNKSLPSKIIKNQEKEISTTVTAAFMGMRKDVFDELGGFDEGYIRGDFEDTDLCLKALQRGLKIGIIRDLKIFHIERMSQGIGLESFKRHKLTLTNSVRQSTKWADLINSKLPTIGQVK
jgi:GT2 family glycosyltransferase